MQDSLLAAQFPLPEHLAMQKELLLAHSKPLKRVIRPDGKDLEGEFGSGAITLLLDEIDGEPQYLYGHLPDSDVRMEFILYRISSSKLDALQPGQRYRLHWIESVVGTQPFDDDRYRLFVVWRVEGV